MGRRKKVTVIEDQGDEPIGEPSPAELAAVEEAQEKEMQEKIQTDVWLSEFKARFTDQPVKILVERFDEDGEWAVCRKYPLSSFDPDTVRIEYGGGKYRCTLFDPSGKWVKEGRSYFKFAESLVKTIPERKPDNPLENPVVMLMLKAQENQQHMLMELAKSFLTAPNVPGSGRGGGLTEIVEVVKSLNSMAPKDKPFDNFKETLGLVKLVKEATGPDDGEGKGGLMSELRQFLEIYPMIKDQLATLKPPTIGSPTAVTVETQPKVPADPLTKKIIDIVPKFVGGARANAPIKEWGAYLLDVFDGEILPLLLPVMRQKYGALAQTEDDVYDIVIRLSKDLSERELALKQIPPLAPYAAWVNQVIDAALVLAETPEGELSTGGNSILEAVGANGNKGAETQGEEKPV